MHLNFNTSHLAHRTSRTMIGSWHHNVVCLSVCLSVTHARIVAKRYILRQKCQNK